MKKCCLGFTLLFVLGFVQAACNLPTLVEQHPTTPQPPGPTSEPLPTSTTAPEITPLPTEKVTATPLAVTWNKIGMPPGAQKTYGILVHPEDENLWLVLGYPNSDYSVCAIYRTTNAGQSWETVLTGGQVRGIALDPENSNTLYSTNEGKLIRSDDRGQTWSTVNDFGDMIESFHLSPIDGAIFVLPRWYSSSDPGVYRSMDGGQHWERFSFGGTLPNFIPWDIEEDPNNGLLYVVIEIGDHPQPYDPPFYRSRDRGESWEDVGADLPWHGISIQVDPRTSDVYFLSEGSGLYKSIDQGSHWARIDSGTRFTCKLFLDPANPPRLFGGDYFYEPRFDGGVYYSDDGGESFVFLGLEGQTTCELTLNSSSTMLYVVSFQQGIYTAVIPAP
ncbi:MAG: hypothetical protein ABFS17_07085 [Chloroflexota bacterium]